MGEDYQEEGGREEGGVNANSPIQDYITTPQAVSV